MNDQQKISEILERRDYFDLHFPVIEGCSARQDISFRLSNTCPSCGYMALGGRCGWETCTFCFWEDDGQDNEDADRVAGGPNGDYSLTAYRLEIFDWMREIREDESIENSIGAELRKLDNYILNAEVDRASILNQIRILCRLFSINRGIEGLHGPDWKFLTEQQIAQLKPAYKRS